MLLDISKITKVYIEKLQQQKKMKKDKKKMTHLAVKMEFKKKFKRLQFFMVQGSLNPNITFLGEKLLPLASCSSFRSSDKQTRTSYGFGCTLQVIQAAEEFLVFIGWSWPKNAVSCQPDSGIPVGCVWRFEEHFHRGINLWGRYSSLSAGDAVVCYVQSCA